METVSHKPSAMSFFMNSSSSTGVIANNQTNRLCTRFRDQPLDHSGTAIDSSMLSIDGGTMDMEDDSPPLNFHTNLSQISMYSGYVSDDEATDLDEPTDSGRTTRSSARRANQPSAGQDKQPTQTTGNNINIQTSIETNASGSRGKKRKRKGSDGEESEHDSGDNSKSHCKSNVTNNSSEPVCLCPKNVMRCIGILPSLAIVGNFNDSDDSHSSLNEDLSYTVLPTVSRNPKGGGGGES